MKLIQIRNATIKITYGGITFLIDPWLQDKGTGMCAPTVNPAMAGVKSPLNDLPFPISEILQGVDYGLITHLHPDHFTADYLPTDMKFLVQNTEDCQRLKELGFLNAAVVEDGQKIGNVKIKKTPALHGDNTPLAMEMGQVTGYLFTGEEKSLYLASDTIFYEGVADILREFSPDVIILNCCEATLPEGRLIMSLEDIASVCKMCPASVVIATHLDSVNHALLSSKDVRQFVKDRGLNQVIVPSNGDCLKFGSSAGISRCR